MSQSYIFCNMKDLPQSLPRQIAIPLNNVCNKLSIKKSIGYTQNLYNWTKIDSSKSHKMLSNLSLRNSFTGSPDEGIFMLLSNWSDFYLAMMIKAIFEANRYIEQGDDEGIIQCLQEINEAWKEINSHMHVMYLQNDPQFYYTTVRPYLGGWSSKEQFPKGLLFEGVYTSDGEEVTLDSEGGSAGNDPSFQIFERGMGIKMGGAIAESQKVMASGFIAPHKKLVDFMDQNSQIRAYVIERRSETMTKLYNDVIDKYIAFTNFHWGYIIKYILKNVKRRAEELTGQGNTPLTTVKSKAQALAELKIPL